VVSSWTASPTAPAVARSTGTSPVTIQVGLPSTSTLNLWGPFAGYGNRRHHTGWLMNHHGDQAPRLLDRVEERFAGREVRDARLRRTSLTAQGLIVETRPYLLIQRGLVSLGLYITAIGRDLFISTVSYLKPPVSNLRVLIAGAMGVFQLFMWFAYPAAVSGAANEFMSSVSVFGGGSSSAAGGLVTLFCLIGPLGLVNTLALLILAGFSAYKWLTEKDLMAALRVPANEFNEDDLMALEKAVEETVRQALTEFQLDPNELKVTSLEAGNRLF
jgi:hypothetical protein